MSLPFRRARSTPVVEIGLLVLLALWLFRAALFSGGVYYKRDIHLVFVPQVEGFVRAVIGGAWPVWDDSPAFGQPLLADPSAQILYPPTWLNLLMRPWTYYTLFALAHFVWAAAGMRALARHLGLSPPAALQSGAAFALSGPFVSMVDLWHHYAGASFMPWVVLAGVRAAEGRRRDAGWLALALALQIVAGSADLVAMTLAMTGGVVLARLRRDRPSLRDLGGPLARLAAGGLVGLAVSAALWMPALDLVSRAARANLPDAVRTYWSLHPLVALETTWPGLFSALPLRPEVRGAFFESREPFLSSLYLGVVVLALCGSAASASRHPLRGVLLAAFVLAVLFAMGPHTPLHGAVTALVPPLRILRYPVKVMVVAAFAATLLAGMGADAWRGDRGRRAAGGAAWPALFILLGTVGISLALLTWPALLAGPWLDPASAIPVQAVVSSALPRLFVPAALLAAVVGAGWLARRPGSSATSAAAVLSLLAVVDLGSYHRTPNPVAPPALYAHRPELVDALPPSSRVYVYDYSVPGKVERHLQGKHPQKLARMPEGWTVDAASALAMQMYLAPETGGRYGLSQGFNVDYRGLHSTGLVRLTRLLLETEGSPLHLRILQLGGVDHLVSLHPDADLGAGRAIPGLFEQPILLSRVTDPQPRAYVVAGTSTAQDDEEAVARLLEEDFDPRREVVLAGGPVHAAPPGFAGEARFVSRRADRLELEVRSNAPAFVVVLEGYDPGWRARLDGQEVAVLRANPAHRAVAVPAGTHRLEWVYRPRPLLAGLGLSAVGLLLAGVLAFWREWPA